MTEHIPDSVCTKCKLLGDRINTNNENRIHIAHIFYTLSPSMEYYNRYDDQKVALDAALMIFRAGIRLITNVYGISTHYEYNLAGNLHCHGIIAVSETIAGCDTYLRKIEKVAHGIIGRKWVPHKISCTCRWHDGWDRVYDYVNKSNVFPSAHMEYI